MRIILATSGLCEDAFIQQIFIEHLLRARNCSNLSGYIRKQNKDPCPWALTFLEVRDGRGGKIDDKQ